jgi:hypothetical protein
MAIENEPPALPGVDAIRRRASGDALCERCDTSTHTGRHSPSVCPKGWGIAGTGATEDVRIMLRLFDAECARANAAEFLVALQRSRIEELSSQDATASALQRTRDMYTRMTVCWVGLGEEVTRLRADLAASQREADRWRHGVPIEGDYVCPDALRADAAEQRAKSLEADLESLRAELAAANARVDEMRERAAKVAETLLGRELDEGAVARHATVERVAGAIRAIR